LEWYYYNMKPPVKERGGGGNTPVHKTGERPQFGVFRSD